MCVILYRRVDTWPRQHFCLRYPDTATAALELLKTCIAKRYGPLPDTKYYLVAAKVAVDRKRDIIYVHIHSNKVYIPDISYAADIRV